MQRGSKRRKKQRPAPGASSKHKAKASRVKSGGRVVLLSGGNPQIAKADGDAPVQAYIGALSGWKRDAARRLDALIARAVPGVRKAVKWNSPFYGVAGQGWFLSFHTFTNYIKVGFFRGADLRPLPPGASKQKNVRSIAIRLGAVDESQFAAWVRQAAALPGWLGWAPTRLKSCPKSGAGCTGPAPCPRCCKCWRTN